MQCTATSQVIQQTQNAPKYASNLMLRVDGLDNSHKL